MKYLYRSSVSMALIFNLLLFLRYGGFKIAASLKVKVQS